MMQSGCFNSIYPPPAEARRPVEGWNDTVHTVASWPTGLEEGEGKAGGRDTIN